MHTYRGHMPDPVMMRLPCAVLAALVVAGPGPRAAAAAGPPETRVVVHTVEGSRTSGRLLSLGPEIEVLADGDRRTRIPISDLTGIEFEIAPRPPAGSSPAWVLFPNGDRISAQLLGQQDETLRLRWRAYPDWTPLRVPLEAMTGLMLHPAASSAAELRLLRGMAAADRNADVLLLANREDLSGELLSLSSERCELQTTVGPVDVETAAVLGVAFNPTLVDQPITTDPTALVRLHDGSWLSMTAARMESNNQLRGTTLFGESVGLPIEEIRRIDCFGPRVVSLTALTPASVELRPWVSSPRTLSLRPNRNIRGGFLSLRGVESPRGWGMTSQMRVTFSLDRQFAAFQARIGIDDAAGGGGHAVFAVELDQRRVFTSPPLSGRSEPLDVGPLETRGAVEMALVVEYGKSGDVLDYADWVDAVLIRDAPP